MRQLLVLTLLITLFSFAMPTQAQQNNPILYVALIWHQHQPVYFKDPETNVYIRPWVRVHATKDYLDMAAMLQNYPDIKATFNITPSLIRQLDDLSSGTKDLYQVMAEIPADQLSDSDKQFIAERFFDTNQRIIRRFPRYQELANQRDEMGVDGVVADWTADDFRDLQILFNLAWTDPDWLAQEPLLSLAQKEQGYTEEDKAVLFAEHLRIVQEVIPFHAEMQQTGQIEVTMTPFAHPILPLLVDSNVAAVGMPDEDLPERFTFGQDAVAQVELGVKLYEEHFGAQPRGMWPAEGSVSPGVIQMIANQDIQWIATDEEILARSLEGFDGFTRNSQDTVQQADVMYQPYLATGGRGGQVAVFFRDHLISDKVGFEYSGMTGQEAADDFLQRLENIRQRLIEEGAEGPHVVTVLLDGENAWEYYDNDGKAFLNGMYQGLSDSETLVTVTPSEYLAMTGTPQALDELWPGSWINPTFNTWIGEEEENLAWTYLLQMRQDVQEASKELDEAVLAQVMELVYIAEGSDWFWWYGADQNSGLDSSFDEQFRLYLEQIYLLLGKEVPNFVSVPIIPQAAVEPTRPFIASFSPVIDGVAGPDEWKDAGFYDLGDAAGFYYGFDDNNLYLRLEGVTGDTVSFYVRGPDPGDSNAYPRGEEDNLPLIGFGAKRLIEVAGLSSNTPAVTSYMPDGDGGWQALDSSSIIMESSGELLELAVPLGGVSETARGGDRLNIRILVDNTTLYPSEGPVLATLPDQAVPNVFLQVEDPAGDDYGPGTYTYPTDAVFRPAAYDAVGFTVGYDDEEVIFQVNLRGPLVNDWGAPNGMGILTLDIYIDVDGAENGARLLLPGRNAALTSEYAWDYAIFAEGWTPDIYVPTDEGPVVAENSNLTIITNPGQRRVTIRVPRSVLSGDPAAWSYAVTVASQEGFPAAGVLRIRDVEAESSQWRLGGGTGAINQTRLLDIIWPPGNIPDQTELLGSYPEVAGPLDVLLPDDFPQVPMIKG